VIDWLENNGLTDEVASQLTQYKNDGTFDSIIQGSVFTDFTNQQTTQDNKIANINQVIGVNLTDYPIVLPETDDTARLKRAVAALTLTDLSPSPSGYKTTTLTQLTLPSGIIKLSDEIDLSDVVLIVSEGRTIIQQTNSSKNIFTIDPIYNVTILGVQFVGGKNAIYCENTADLDSTMIDIERCEFHFQSDYAVKVIGTISANLTIRKCKFMKPHGAVYSDCDNALIEDCWVHVHTDNFSNNMAVFVNHKGTMRFNSMFGVPKCGTDSTRLTSVRWVDNYNNFRAVNSRFGGEDDGIPIVYHYGIVNNGDHMGSVVEIKNSQICCGLKYKYSDASVIHCMTNIPQLIELSGNDYLLDSPYISVDASINLDTYFDSMTNPETLFTMNIENNMNYGVTAFGQAFPIQLQRFLNKGHFNENLFPMIPYNESRIDASHYQYQFDIPKGYKTFTWLVTVSATHNAVDTDCRNTVTYIVSMTTGLSVTDATTYIQLLSYSPLYQPTPPSQYVAETVEPTITSCYFGTGTSGSNQRNETDGGQFSLIFNNLNAGLAINIVPLHMGA
jgi:hypothetical protein